MRGALICLGIKDEHGYLKESKPLEKKTDSYNGSEDNKFCRLVAIETNGNLQSFREHMKSLATMDSNWSGGLKFKRINSNLAADDMREVMQESGFGSLCKFNKPTVDAFRIIGTNEEVGGEVQYAVVCWQKEVDRHAMENLEKLGYVTKSDDSSPVKNLRCALFMIDKRLGTLNKVNTFTKYQGVDVVDTALREAEKYVKSYEKRLALAELLGTSVNESKDVRLSEFIKDSDVTAKKLRGINVTDQSFKQILCLGEYMFTLDCTMGGVESPYKFIGVIFLDSENYTNFLTMLISTGLSNPRTSLHLEDEFGLGLKEAYIPGYTSVSDWEDGHKEKEEKTHDIKEQASKEEEKTLDVEKDEQFAEVEEEKEKDKETEGTEQSNVKIRPRTRNNDTQGKEDSTKKREVSRVRVPDVDLKSQVWCLVIKAVRQTSEMSLDDSWAAESLVIGELLQPEGWKYPMDRIPSTVINFILYDFMMDYPESNYNGIEVIGDEQDKPRVAAAKLGMEHVLYMEDSDIRVTKVQVRYEDIVTGYYTVVFKGVDKGIIDSDIAKGLDTSTWTSLRVER